MKAKRTIKKRITTVASLEGGDVFVVGVTPNIDDGIYIKVSDILSISDIDIDVSRTDFAINVESGDLVEFTNPNTVVQKVDYKFRVNITI